MSWDRLRGQKEKGRYMKRKKEREVDVTVFGDCAGRVSEIALVWKLDCMTGSNLFSFVVTETNFAIPSLLRFEYLLRATETNLLPLCPSMQALNWLLRWQVFPLVFDEKIATVSEKKHFIYTRRIKEWRKEGKIRCTLSGKQKQKKYTRMKDRRGLKKRMKEKNKHTKHE